MSSTLGNLFAATRGSLEDPHTPISSASIEQSMFGGNASAAGVPVTEKKVYGLTPYYRGVGITASTMAALPLKVFQNNTRTRVTRRTVLDNPNRRQTPFEFWQSMFANAIGWGNGYGFKVLDGMDIVREVHVIHPGSVRLEPVDVSDSFPDGKLFLVTDRKGRERALSSRRVLHLPYLSPMGFEGLRPIELAKDSLGISIAAERTAGGFYARGANISGVLSTDQKLDEEVATRLRSRWKQTYQGPTNAGDIAIVDAGATFKAVGLPPGDAELLSSRKFSIDEIARLIGLPPWMLGATEKSTSWGTGIEQQFITWVQVTLLGWLTLTAQRVTRELLPGGWTAGSWYAEHSVEGLLRGDSKTRAAFYNRAIMDGWMNRNEVRVRENLEPEDGLDEFLVPSNLTLISVDGELVPLSSAGVGDDGTNADTDEND